MKKRLFMMAAIVVGLGLTACSVDSSGLEDAADDLKKEMNDGGEKTDEAADKAEKVEMKDDSAPKGDVSYQCPDDCDNGPVYSKPGPCNKCGKEMVLF